MGSNRPMLDELIDEAAEVVRGSRRVVVFTGAGVSAASGIPTFRDDGGFWTEFPPEQFANWRGIARAALLQPRRFAQFLHAVIGPIASAEPNAAHRAIADAEQHVRIDIITQNIDALHQAAGSSPVHEIHGSFFETTTLAGRFVSFIDRRQLRSAARGLDRARRGWFPLLRSLVAVRLLVGVGRRGVYRPGLVMFGDSMAEPTWTDAQAVINKCDCLIQIGCSGLVHPAAMIPLDAKAAGAVVVAIDPQPTEADIWLEGRATEITPELFDRAFGCQVV